MRDKRLCLREKSYLNSLHKFSVGPARQIRKLRVCETMNRRSFLPVLLASLLWLTVPSKQQQPLENTNLYLLLNDLSSCLIHYVEYHADIVDFAKLQYPYLFSSTKLWRPNPTYQALPIFKMDHIECFVTIFLIEGKGLKLAISERVGAGKDPFSFIINSLNVYQQFVLFLSRTKRLGDKELSFVRSLRINHQTFLTPIFFFQYVTVPSNTASLPEALQLSSTTAAATILKRGWFVCKYCSLYGFTVTRFDCKAELSCYSSMLSAYVSQIDDGKNVLWQVYNDAGNLDPDLYDQISDHPFEISKETDITRLTMSFLLSPLNRTLLKEAAGLDKLISRTQYQTPKIIRKVDRIYGRGTMMIVGASRTYIFITADRVQDIYDSRNFYVAPFNMNVWQLLIGILLFISVIVCVAYLTEGGFPSSRIGWTTFLWIAGIMLEQNDMKRRPVKTKNETALQTSATVYAFWIVTCLLLSGFYKGRVSANYSVINPFGTKWRYLHQLVNFTLYSAIGNCQFFTEFPYTISNDTKPNLTTLCRHYPMDGFDNINCKFWTDLTEKIYHMQYLALPSAKNQRALGRLRLMESKLSYTCRDYMDKLVANEMLLPRTAFVISRADFPAYWEYFEQAMARNSSIKFGNNENVVEGTSLHTWRVYFLNTVDKWHKNLLKSRLRALNTFGFMQLWERSSLFNRNYRAYGSQAVRKAHRENRITLTFGGSDIQVIFFTLLLGMTVNIGVLIAENIYHRMMKIRRAKTCPFEYLK